MQRAQSSNNIYFLLEVGYEKIHPSDIWRKLALEIFNYLHKSVENKHNIALHDDL